MHHASSDRKIRLIALDLDDTLLRADLSISETNKSALHRAEQVGIRIVLASGRNLVSMKRYADELLIHRRGDFLIGSNGAELLRASSGEVVERLHLPPELALRLAREIEKKGFFWQVYADGAIWCNRMNAWAQKDHELTGQPLHVIEDVERIFARPHIKIVVCGDPERIEMLYRELCSEYADSIEVVTSKPYFLEVLPPGVSKGTALARLAQRLSIDMDAVLAIGDARNDYEMIRMAGWGCAPANAAEEVRQIARYVSPCTNEEDAVAEIIGHVVFGE
ncbi:MAG: Cof-type HAD-IIB family hydrolase [Spirochaetales bacterium]|nr:Cof-type HAD-IIB family hydrolase [Spirochaetales bacterium]